MYRLPSSSSGVAVALLALSLLNKAIGAQDVDLVALGTVHPGFRIDGFETAALSGYSVSGAGDVNGDGLADLIVGVPTGPGAYGRAAGSAHVIFGKSGSEPVTISALGAGGFQITVDYGGRTGTSVSAAGDVNGDGLDDLILGTIDTPSLVGGQAFVIFGKTSSDTVFVSAPEFSGFQIIGGQAADQTGISVSGAGDVNGDGLADVIVGSSQAGRATRINSGESTVIFGKTSTDDIYLSALGTAGFKILGANAYDYTGRSVSGAGDVNGDGLADLIVGSFPATTGDSSDPGRAYVVFGQTSTDLIDLRSPGAKGFAIVGRASESTTGRSVAGAGDVNGDGLADLIVATPNDDRGVSGGLGESDIVFGKSSTDAVVVGHGGYAGFRIEGIYGSAFQGASASGAGDLNGDGFADLIVGLASETVRERALAGRSAVIFGKSTVSTVELTSLGTSGFHLDGALPVGYTGWSVSGAGDVNGDGLADVIIGAPFSSLGASAAAGVSYVVFSGITPPSATATYKSIAGPANAPRIAIGVSGDGTNESTPDARAWIDFADGESASTQTVRLLRNTSELSGLSNIALVAWQISTNRANWTPADVTFKYLENEVHSVHEDTLQLYRSPDADGPWEPLPNPALNTKRNTVSGSMASEGYFVLMGEPIVIRNGWMLM